ncbi:MAG TPA: enoyl-CoA hydratase-related protein [Xanthobacteraceae bacterium]|jgi:methylglutaconyl-CoA hydratase|nr:enoyl-CoA hydratase-related protein [Xanthobacteraceae bacterium]
MSAPKLLKQLSSRHILTLTLNRPEVGNACDPGLLTALAAALDEAAVDASVRVVILRGAGKHFCTGADISATWFDGAIRFPQICKRLDDIAKPVVAVIQGSCIGGGIALAACCDSVVAEDAAFFALPELRIGIAPGALILYVLRAMGARAVRHYLLTGERFPAAVAQQCGLVHVVASQSDLEAQVAKLVDGFLLGAPHASAKVKAALKKYGDTMIGDDAINAMEALFREQSGSAEASEGRASFREKRRPNWYPPESGAKTE